VQEAQNRAFSEDLAVRICFVIALDHFGDYAAESVVAPVRETCAQILGALATSLEPVAARGLISVLIRMQTRGEWHVRHASFLALKYTAALCVDNLEELATQLIPVIVGGLNDPDDEVRAAAAETLIPLCGKLLGATGEVAQHLKSAAQRCWQMLLDDDSNVTTMAMMKLATALDFGPSQSLESDLALLHARARRMLVFLSHTSVEVRTAAIRMLSSLVGVVADSPRWCTQQFSDEVLCKLFYVLLCETVDDLVKNACDLWQSLLELLPTEHLVAVAARARAWLKLVATHDAQAAHPSTVADSFAGCESCGMPKQLSMYPDAERASRCRLRCCQALGALVSKWPAQTTTTVLTAIASELGKSRNAWERQCCALLVANCNAEAEVLPVLRDTIDDICCTTCVNFEAGQCYAELRSLHSTLQGQAESMQNALGRAAAAGSVAPKLRRDLSIFAASPDIVNTALQLCTIIFDEYFAILQSVTKRGQQTHSDLVRSLLQLRENTAATIGRYTQERARFDTAVMSSGAAALVATGMVPTKLNPVVKSLMNAVKREQSVDLQRYAAESLVQMSLWCSNNGKAKVSDRILQNVCALLCDPSDSDIGERINDDVLDRDEDEIDDETARQHACRGANAVLAELCRVHGGSLFTKAAALHQAITVSILRIHETRAAPELEFIEAAKSLRLCGALGKNVQGDALSIIVALIPAVLCCVGFGKSEMLNAACRCLGFIAKKVSTMAEHMHALLVGMASMLADSLHPSARLGAAHALHEVLTVLNLEIVPFLTQLVVPVMGAMSDSDKSVRQIATLCFCMLVKLMPLEAGTEVPTGLSSTMLAAREQQRKFIAQLVGERPPEPYSIPVPLNTPLRKYQQEGVNWLAFLRSFRLHGILCDEMGLGKTLTTLCIIVGDTYDRKQAHAKAKSGDSAPLPNLVVCPATLVGHWYDEVQKHCHTPLSTIRYAGTPRQREQLRAGLPDAEVVIVSYETVRADIEFLAKCCFNYCVLDEGHIIRNSKAKVTRAVKRLVSNHRLILSGTPVQNSVAELWSMFDFLMPGFLGTERHFNARFGRPINSGKSRQRAGDTSSVLAMEALHRQVLPFILGRTKQQVLTDLPPKIIQDIMCDISPLQKRLYDQFENSSACKDSVQSLAASGSRAAGSVLQSLQYMRKISNHPALVLTESHPLHGSITAELERSGSSLRDMHHAPKLIALR
jgi:TATA-binding protein-associated factor